MRKAPKRNRKEMQQVAKECVSKIPASLSASQKNAQTGAEWNLTKSELDPPVVMNLFSHRRESEKAPLVGWLKRSSLRTSDLIPKKDDIPFIAKIL